MLQLKFTTLYTSVCALNCDISASIMLLFPAHIHYFPASLTHLGQGHRVLLFSLFSRNKFRAKESKNVSLILHKNWKYGIVVHEALYINENLWGDTTHDVIYNERNMSPEADKQKLSSSFSASFSNWHRWFIEQTLGNWELLLCGAEF